MRLFSPFDSFFFNFSILSIFLVPLLLRASFWLNNLVSYSKNSFVYAMSFFFSRVNSFKFKTFDTFLLGLMLTILFFNFLSILPFFFSFTSQVSFNFFWGLRLWLGLFSFGVINNLKYVLSHFVPEGTPTPLIWFLFFVELISNIIRPLTLVVRLLANILAGHLLIILLSKMVFIFMPLTIIYAGLNLVEFFVSLIQSYIFVTMLCLYFSEMS